MMLTLENTTINFTGIKSGGLASDEDRILIYFDVITNDEVYNWFRYAPNTTTNFVDYLASIKETIINEINTKEELWLVTPHTKELDDRFTNSKITVEVAKSSIVAPEINDYYALRRREYPLVREQIAAIYKGTESLEYQTIVGKIQAVKDKYPKPQ